MIARRWLIHPLATALLAGSLLASPFILSSMALTQPSPADEPSQSPTETP